MHVNADNLKKLADECSDRTLQRSLLDVNTDLFKQVCLNTLMLSTDHSPSLHLVYPTKVQLTNKLQPMAGDGPAVAELKCRLVSKVNTFFHIKPQHCVATLLDPRMKTGVLSVQERLDAVAALRQMMAEVSNDEAAPATITEPAAKRRKLD